MEERARCRREDIRFLQLVSSVSEADFRINITPIYPDVCPDLPVQERRLDKLPLETVVLCHPDRAFLPLVFEILVLQAVHHERPLFLCQEARGFREVE